MTDYSDPKSRATFFARERKRLIGYVRSLIDDAGDREGEDIVQDVMVNIFDQGDLTAPIANFSSYVYQALRNRVVDYFRRRRKHESLDEALPGDSGLTLADALADLRLDAAADFERDEVRRDVDCAIAMLDEPDKAIVTATEIDGATFQELSDEWEVPIGTLLARKSRAMKKIREALFQIDPEHYSSLLLKERTPYAAS